MCKLNSVIESTISEIQKSELIGIQKNQLLRLRSEVDRIINKLFNEGNNPVANPAEAFIPKKCKLKQTTQVCRKSTQATTKSTQNNVILHGFQNYNYNNKGSLETQAQEFLKTKLNLEISHFDVQPLGKQNNSILVKLSSIRDKFRIFKNCNKLRKEEGVFISEDLTKADRIKRKQQLGDLIRAKQQGKKAYFRGATLII
jgi:hypothetical protein